MAKREVKRVMRTRKLTPEEVARDRDIRRRVQEEFPPTGPSEDAPHSLSGALKKAIRDSGKSVYQIGKEANVSQIVISRFLSGERDIRMATADRLAQSLGLMLRTE